MIVDVIQNIIHYCQLRSVINLCEMDKHTYQNTYVYEINEKSYGYNKIEPHVLCQKKYSKLRKLYVSHNKKLVDISNLSHTLIHLEIGPHACISNIYSFSDLLTTLICRGNMSCMNQECINKFTKLQKLCIQGNKRIINLNHLAKTLIKLNCSFTNIDQTGISNLNLISISVCGTRNINNLNHMKNTMQVLKCDENSGINQNGINKLVNLRKFYCNNNPNIYSANHMSKSLQILEVIGLESGIGQDGIAKLRNIHSLNIKDNRNIRDLNHMADTLTELNCGGIFCGISQNGIRLLSGIRKLNIDYNGNIFDLNHMKKLEILKCCGIYSKINNDSICQLNNITYLDLYDNMYVSNLENLSYTLERLSCGGQSCIIDQNTIVKLKNIVHLDMYCNYNVTDISHLWKSLRSLNCGASMVGQNCIEKLPYLHTLDVSHNKLITNVNHLCKSLIYLYCNGSSSGLGSEGINKLEKICYMESYRNSKVGTIDKIKHILIKHNDRFV